MEHTSLRFCAEIRARDVNFIIMVIELAFKFTRQDEVAIEEFRKHQGWGNIIKTSQWPIGKKEISWRLVPWNPSVDKYS